MVDRNAFSWGLFCLSNSAFPRKESGFSLPCYRIYLYPAFFLADFASLRTVSWSPVVRSISANFSLDKYFHNQIAFLVTVSFVALFQHHLPLTTSTQISSFTFTISPSVRLIQRIGHLTHAKHSNHTQTI